MKNILIVMLSVLVFTGGTTTAYAQGSRSVQPPDFCTAFPDDVSCGGDGQADAPVDPLPSPEVVPNPPTQPEVAPTTPTNEPVTAPEPTVTPEQPTENIEDILEEDNTVTKEKDEIIAQASDENNENRVLIGLLKILTYIYLVVTGLLFGLFATIGLITYFTRNNKDLGPIPSGFIKVPLVCGGFFLLGWVALYILQMI